MSSDVADLTLVLRHPRGSRLGSSQVGSVVHVSGSGGVALDERLAALWQAADGRTRSELESMPQFCNAACLDAELTALRVAGLLLPPLDATTSSAETRLPEPPPLVSVVIVSRNGRHHLQECLPSVMTQTYPQVEVIVVDDQSTDGTDDYLRASFPAVRVVKQSGGPNFAAGCNLGIQHASGELIFLLNNDTVLDPRCVQELVAAQSGREPVGGAAAMLRFYDNKPFINGLGSYVPPRGFGHDVAIGSLDVGQFDGVDQVPLLCFGAALLRRAALDRVGLVDEAYAFYYEDADWSYRARALGLALIAAPRARVYHKFGASVGELPSAFKMRLATRNRLRFALKNLPAREAVRQLLIHALDDVLRLLGYLLRGHGRLAWSIASAWGEFVRTVPRILNLRRQMWRGRTRQPVNLSALAQPFPLPEMQWKYPRLTQWVIENRYRPYLDRLCLSHDCHSEMTKRNSATRRRVLIISPDTVDAKMGGVGVRYWELARVLAEHAQVTLAVPHETALAPQTFSIRTYQEGRAETLKPLVDAADIVLLSGFVIYHHPFLRDMPQYRVIDLYDPTVLENLERFAARSLDEQNALHHTGVIAYNDLFTLGDFFICATEKQRDYWLGALTSANRVNPTTYAADPTLRRLIDVVPFGLPDDPPQHTQRVLKGTHPRIGENDKVILWGGGLWDWFDPLTAIEAMPRVLERVPQARLFFVGTRHPNPDVPASRMAQRAIQRATELGLKDRTVFFNDWVAYSQRQNYLLEADIGISLHGDHIEARFSVRTRLMDYLWANLPMVVTGGDALSDLVVANGLGRVVAPGSVDDVAQALSELLQVPIDRARFQSVAARLRWSRVAEPLVRYIAEPWRDGSTPRGAAPARQVIPVWQLPRRAVSVLMRRGPMGLWRALRSYLER